MPRLGGPLLALLILSFSFGCRRQTDPVSQVAHPAVRGMDGYLQVGPFRRHYIVHLPSSKKSDRFPVVFFYHERGGTAAEAEGYYDWDKEADREGFAVVYLDGLGADPTHPADPKANPSVWRFGLPRDKVGAVVVDGEFTKVVFRALRSEFPVDRGHIYAAGFSFGGSMAYHVIDSMPDTFAAIGVVCAPLVEPPTRLRSQVPLITILGAQDPFLSLDAKQRQGDPVVTAFDSPVRWAVLNGCSPTPKKVEAPGGIQKDAFSNKAGKVMVERLVIADLGHSWPGDRPLLTGRSGAPQSNRIDATEAVWSFFKTRSIPWD